MSEPVAKLHLDTRSFGPPYCDKCDADVEDAFLMSDGSIVCVDCKEPVEGMDEISKYFTAASPVAGPKRKKRDSWIIEWRNIDSSRDETVSYDSREEAFEAACDFIKDFADNELKSVDWDEEDEDDKETVETLKKIIDDIEKGNQRDAIIGWLDYQGMIDPDESIAIGPSGNVSDSSHDFAYMTK